MGVIGKHEYNDLKVWSNTLCNIGYIVKYKYVLHHLANILCTYIPYGAQKILASKIDQISNVMFNSLLYCDCCSVRGN